MKPPRSFISSTLCPIVAASCAVMLLVACATRTDTPTSDDTEPTPKERTRGFAPTVRELASELDGQLQGLVDTARIEANLKKLTAGRNDPGQAGNAKTARFIQEQFQVAGLETRTETYQVLIPRCEVATAELIEPVAYRAIFEEAPFKQDFDTHAKDGPPPGILYAADGDVSGPLLYVHQARTGDFEALRNKKLTLAGCIGIARDTGPDTGTKLYNAAQAGLIGLIVYSDPRDRGYGQGPEYPDGPWLPTSGARQRSGIDLGAHPGDPLTPGKPAVANASRLALDEASSLPRIPAISLSAQDARPFLEHLKGPAVPSGWQGGHPFSYRTGDGESGFVRLALKSDWRLLPITNVIATLRGSTSPREQIILGAQRDAQGRGALDAASGTAVLLEVARVFSELARRGLGPSRTVVFCAFDGGSLGHLGATEFCEAQSEALLQTTGFYFDLDAEISGGALEIAGEPQLDDLVKGSLAAFFGPRPKLDELLAQNALAPLGGAGDHAPFQHHVGIPVLSLKGPGPRAVVGSRYDTFGWMKSQGDPGFSRHARLVRLACHLAWRGASATLLPLDFPATARWMRSELGRLKFPEPSEEWQPLAAELDRFEAAAERFEQARDQWLSEDRDPLEARKFALGQKNVLGPFIDQARKTAFYRNLLVTPDAETLARPRPFGHLAQALEGDDAQRIATERERLTSAFKTAADRLERMADALTTRASRTASASS